MAQIVFKVKRNEFIVVEPFAMTASQHYYVYCRRFVGDVKRENYLLIKPVNKNLIDP